MTESITPPPELLKHWEYQYFYEGENYDVMLIQAYQAGADQELEACCEWLESNDYNVVPRELRAARRPSPLNVKQQGLEALRRFNANVHTTASEMIADFDTICRAIKALPDD